MKENRKLLREVLKDIRHDMTDEEVLNLLADSKISENPAGEKENTPSASGRRAACTKKSPQSLENKGFAGNLINLPQIYDNCQRKSAEICMKLPPAFCRR